MRRNKSPPQLSFIGRYIGAEISFIGRYIGAEMPLFDGRIFVELSLSLSLSVWKLKTDIITWAKFHCVACAEIILVNCTPYTVPVKPRNGHFGILDVLVIGSPEKGWEKRVKRTQAKIALRKHIYSI